MPNFSSIKLTETIQERKAILAGRGIEPIQEAA